MTETKIAREARRIRNAKARASVGGKFSKHSPLPAFRKANTGW